jgi:hypothetical protein
VTLPKHCKGAHSIIKITNHDVSDKRSTVPLGTYKPMLNHDMGFFNEDNSVDAIPV